MMRSSSRIVLAAACLLLSLSAFSQETALNPLQEFDDFVAARHARREAQRQVDNKEYAEAAKSYEKMAEAEMAKGQRIEDIVKEQAAQEKAAKEARDKAEQAAETAREEAERAVRAAQEAQEKADLEAQKAKEARESREAKAAREEQIIKEKLDKAKKDKDATEVSTFRAEKAAREARRAAEQEYIASEAEVNAAQQRAEQAAAAANEAKAAAEAARDAHDKAVAEAQAIREAEGARAIEALKDIEGMVDADPAVVAMNYLAAADCYLEAGKTNRARKMYSRILKEYLYYVPLPVVLEKMREVADNYENGKGTVLWLRDSLAAIEVYREIIRVQPDITQSLDDRMVLAGKLERDGQDGEAVNVYQEIIKLAPQNPDVRLALARLLYKLTCENDSDGERGRAAMREARSFLELSAKGDPRRPEAEQISTDCREREAERLVKQAEFYLNKYHYRPEVARRYLYDISREYPETHGALQAKILLERNFKESAE